MSKKADTSQAEKAVFDYLHRQNRPYSVVDIGNNLHNEVGKTAIQKAMEQLTAAGRVREKIYGKQKVYVVNQDLFDAVDPTQIRALDDQIGQQTLRASELQKEMRQLESELAKWNSSVSTEEAETTVQKTEKEIELLRGQVEAELAAIAALKLKPVSTEERAKCDAQRKKLVVEWRKRKRLANDIVSAILEGYPKSKKILLEEIGIETDEDLHVLLPEC